MMKFQAKILVLLLPLIFLVSCAEEIGVPEKVTAGVENGEIKVVWSEADNATEYRLYRKTEGNADYKFVTDTDKTEFVDSLAPAGYSYQYKVVAMGNGRIAAQGAESQPVANPTVVASVTRVDKYTVLVMLEGTIENQWYEILRSSEPNGEFTVIANTDKNIYKDTGLDGKEYYYSVRPEGSSDVQGLSFASIGTSEKETVSIPALMYHEFVVQEDLDSGVLFDEYAIWREEFESDLVWLQQNGYTTVTTEDIIRYISGEDTMPSKPILLTIDDGKLGVYKHAYPLLKQYNMKAVLAVIGAEVEAASTHPELREGHEAPYCTWDEIKEMSESGAVEIISHTYGLHVNNNGDRTGANCAEGEALENYLPVAKEDYKKINEKIKLVTGADVKALAYPYSVRSLTSDEAWLLCGYDIFFSGNGYDVQPTASNYFIQGLGKDNNLSVLRRVARMTGTPISEYVKDIEEADKY